MRSASRSAALYRAPAGYHGNTLGAGGRRRRWRREAMRRCCRRRSATSRRPSPIMNSVTMSRSRLCGAAGENWRGWSSARSRHRGGVHRRAGGGHDCGYVPPPELFPCHQRYLQSPWRAADPRRSHAAWDAPGTLHARAGGIARTQAVAKTGWRLPADRRVASSTIHRHLRDSSGAFQPSIPISRTRSPARRRSVQRTISDEQLLDPVKARGGQLERRRPTFWQSPPCRRYSRPWPVRAINWWPSRHARTVRSRPQAEPEDQGGGVSSAGLALPGSGLPAAPRRSFCNRPMARDLGGYRRDRRPPWHSRRKCFEECWSLAGG